MDRMDELKSTSEQNSKSVSDGSDVKTDNQKEDGSLAKHAVVRRRHTAHGQGDESKTKAEKKKKRKSIVSSLPGRHYGFRRKESRNTVSLADGASIPSPIPESISAPAFPTDKNIDTTSDGSVAEQAEEASQSGIAALPTIAASDSDCQDIVIPVPQNSEMNQTLAQEPIYDTVPFPLSPVTDKSTVLLGTDDDVDLLFARWCKLRQVPVVEERARRLGLAWLPLGITDTDVAEFVSAFPADQVQRLGSLGARRRQLNLLRQFPLSDMSPEYNHQLGSLDTPVFHEFVAARDSLSLDEGLVTRLSTAIDCKACQQQIVSGKLAIKAALLPDAAWHLNCFACGICGEPITDLLYCQLRGQLLCVRDYGQQLHDRCISCDALVFSGEYVRAQNRAWHRECLKCRRCSTPLADKQFGLKDGTAYCLECYSSGTISTCTTCQQAISLSDRELKYGGKHWHATCFCCSSCHGTLEGKPFGMREDRLLCAACFINPMAPPVQKPCSSCGEAITTTDRFMDSHSGQWHERCFTCCQCEQPLESRTFMPKEDRLYCSRCYEETFAARCHSCNQPITSVGVTYQGDTWHRDCFCCAGCQTGLAGHKFRSHESLPYCGNCYREKFGPRCARCHQPIPTERGTRYSAFENRCWHNACFTCGRCSVSLVGKGFLDMDGEVVCPDCGRRALERIPPTGEDRAMSPEPSDSPSTPSHVYEDVSEA